MSERPPVAKMVRRKEEIVGATQMRSRVQLSVLWMSSVVNRRNKGIDYSNIIVSNV